jgi:zinc transport system permease protein
MLEIWLEPFFIKALIAGAGVAIATSMVGVFVLWKKMAYFGDAISHSAIFGIGIAVITSVATIYGIIFCAIIFCFLIFALGRQNLYSSDTVIGITSCILLAIGIILIALFPSNISLENYLFGDLIVLSNQDIITIYLITFFTVLVISFWFKKLLLAAINKDLAIISGVNIKRLELKFLLLTALVVAGLVKIVGIFLITSMIIMPAAIARNFAKTPLAMLFISLAASLVMVIGGLFLALFFNIPTSPAIIAFAAILLILSVIFGKVKS